MVNTLILSLIFFLELIMQGMIYKSYFIYHALFFLFLLDTTYLAPIHFYGSFLFLLVCVFQGISFPVSIGLLVLLVGGAHLLHSFFHIGFSVKLLIVTLVMTMVHLVFFWVWVTDSKGILHNNTVWTCFDPDHWDLHICPH